MLRTVALVAALAQAWVPRPRATPKPHAHPRPHAHLRPPTRLRATVERSEFLYAADIEAHSATLASTLAACGRDDRAEMASYADALEGESEYLRPSGRRAVRYAVEVAFLAHRGQKRRSGEPFVTHPVEVAKILARTHMDRDTVVSGLLHDTVEDTDLTFGEVEAMFGVDVRRIVEGETKVSKLPKMARDLPAADAEKEQVENMRSMFIAMAEDWRIVVVKLADRLHNMRTLRFMPPRKRAKISRETLEIFAPLAHRLGMWQYKTELEETSFEHLFPAEYAALDEAIARKRTTVEAALEECRGTLETMLMDDVMIKGRMRTVSIEGRTKSCYSTWKKMQRQQCGIERIDDLVALRVVLKAERPEAEADTSLCYHVLGKVHSTWTPLPRTLKDYISSPKPNGYRSLHTTVLVGSQPLEVQIRTDDMHRVAELGAAAHWAYKDTDASLPWLQIIREWHAQVDSSSVFMQLVRNELLGTRVFVFAPRGRILNLAKGATLADAVAHVVSEESQSDRRGALAYVNGQREDAEYELRNGDIVSFAPPVDRAAEMPIVVEHAAVAPSNWTLCSRCMPVPGDAVFGAAYRHAARGTVHRSDCDCDALRRELQRPGARLVDGAALAMNDDDASAVSRALARDRAVRGADGEIVGFQSSIVVFCRDRTRMLLDVSLAVSAVNIVDVMSETRVPRGQAAFQYTIHVDDVDHLNGLLAAVLEIPDVTAVVRGTMRGLKRNGANAFWSLGGDDTGERLD